jgi:hypothetical protein
MTKLLWDSVGDRVYEAGVSHAVLYLEDGSAVPWNGLVSVSEQFSNKTDAVYFDGAKVMDLVTPDNFSAEIAAITYPEELLEYEGVLDSDFTKGLYFTEQISKSFSMSYQTLVGNDVDGLGAGYQIHILYNLTAKPSNLGYDTNVDESAMLFSWEVTSRPEVIAGVSPTAHLIFDSRYANPGAMDRLEELLYGTVSVDALLLSAADLFTELTAYSVITILDNGDGTWTAIGPSDHISMPTGTTFQILNANARFIDANRYTISSS